jgi:CelD/BcsL family acetyltransferase involved in cellulose biosynthesis
MRERLLGYDICTHVSESDFDTLRSDWESLFALNRLQTLFMRFRWLRSWWSAYGEGRQLKIITARTRDGIVAIAPLFRERRWGVPELHLLGEGRLDELGFLVHPEHLRACQAIGQYLARDRSWQVCELHSWAADSQTRDAFVDGLGSRIVVAERLYERCPFVSCDGRSWEDYLKTHPSRFRKWLKKAERKISSHGDVTMESLAGANLSASHVEELERIDFLSRRSAEGTAHFADPRFASMLRLLLGDTEHGLEVQLLRIDGRSVAAELLGIEDNRLFGIWTGFDRAVDYSGNVIVMQAIRSAFDRGYSAFEFLQGDEAYKLRWANGERSVEQTIISRGRPSAMIRQIGTRLRWRAARDPHIGAVRQRVLDRVRKLRRPSR